MLQWILYLGKTPLIFLVVKHLRLLAKIFQINFENRKEKFIAEKDASTEHNRQSVNKRNQ